VSRGSWLCPRDQSVLSITGATGELPLVAPGSCPIYAWGLHPAHIGVVGTNTLAATAFLPWRLSDEVPCSCICGFSSRGDEGRIVSRPLITSLRISLTYCPKKVRYSDNILPPRGFLMAKPRLASVSPTIENRTVAPLRRPNADLRTREYLTAAEVESLIDAAKGTAMAIATRR
jgi:hypothetical protein